MEVSANVSRAEPTPRREHAGEEPALPASERARLKELEREVRELRMQAEFLKKAAAYFAREYL